MYASVSRTYSNPVTVAHLIRANGLDAVLRGGMVGRDVIDRVRSGLKHGPDAIILRSMLAGRRRADADLWRGLKFARRHGRECMAAAEARPYAARLVSALTDAWAEGCPTGELGRRHGHDVALKIRGWEREEIRAHALAMGLDLRVAAAFDPACPSADLSEVRWKNAASQRIMQRTCKLFGVTKKELVADNRSRAMVIPRQFYCFWAYRMAGMSFPEIGRRMGGRDHTTALHSVREWPNKRAAARALIKERKLTASRAAMRAARRDEVAA